MDLLLEEGYVEVGGVVRLLSNRVILITGQARPASAASTCWLIQAWSAS